MAMYKDNLLFNQARVALLIFDMKNVTDAAEETLGDLEVRLDLLERYWLEFTSRNVILQKASYSLRGYSYFKRKVMHTVTHQKYLESKLWLKKRIEAFQVTPQILMTRTMIQNSGSSNSSSGQDLMVNLRLPPFGGTQQNWKTNKEKFTLLVLFDVLITPVIKFHLSNCLKEESAEKLKGINLTETNVDTMWKTLCRKGDNKYLRFSLPMQSLVNLLTALIESVKHLNQILNTINQSNNTSTALKHSIDKWNDIFVYFVESKLSASIHLDWVKEVENFNLTDFLKHMNNPEFLEDRIWTLDLLELNSKISSFNESINISTHTNSTHSPKESGKFQLSWKPKSTFVNVARQKSRRIFSTIRKPYYGEDHSLTYYQKSILCFRDQQKSHVIHPRIHFNYLKSNHSVDNCESRACNFVINPRHDTKLHPAGQVAVTPSMNAHALIETSSNFILNSHSSILLSTACVILQTPNGQSITIRALLDSGAEESFIAEHIVEILSLDGQIVNIQITGVGGSVTAVATKRVELNLASPNDPDFSSEFTALTLPKLSTLIPHADITSCSWPHLSGLQLADPDFGTPARVDCILSSEIYANVMRPGIQRGPPGTPVAFNSVFGWIIMGSTGCQFNDDQRQTPLHFIIGKSNLIHLVCK